MSFKEGGASHTFHGIRPTSIIALSDKELYGLQGIGLLFQKHCPITFLPA
jgi:cysteine sulfinate desulfinase/cysteine desulfurase-like protein